MKPVNVEDMRVLAKRRLPKIFFDYISGGAFSEATMQANRNDFGRYRLRQRVLVDCSAQDLSTDYLGARHALPFMLGPVGFLGLCTRHGDEKAARAATAAGIPFCASTFSIASISQLRAATSGPLHFQLYVLRDRSLCNELLDVAAAAQIDTLYVTVDAVVTSVRERDARNGFRSLKRLTPGLLAGMAKHPRWCVDRVLAGFPSVGAVAHRPEFGRGVLEQAGTLARAIDKTLSWNDIAWLRERWTGRLAIKGILSVEDAVTARAHGADAVIVSNHGGRQLDAASSTISMLAEIRAAVGADMGVLIDSGFRRGTDVLKAIALGADGVLLGRAYVYGLGARGERGVAEVIAFLREEISISLALMGISSIDELKAKGRSALATGDRGLAREGGGEHY